MSADRELLEHVRRRAAEVGEQALDAFGEDPQILMMIEEAAELTVALAHYRRSREGAPARVVEELADVLVVAEQLVAICGPARVAEAMTAKLDRLEARIDEKRSRTWEAFRRPWPPG